MSETRFVFNIVTGYANKSNRIQHRRGALSPHGCPMCVQRHHRRKFEGGDLHVATEDNKRDESELFRTFPLGLLAHFEALPALISDRASKDLSISNVSQAYHNQKRLLVYVFIMYSKSCIHRVCVRYGFASLCRRHGCWITFSVLYQVLREARVAMNAKHFVKQSVK